MADPAPVFEDRSPALGWFEAAMLAASDVKELADYIHANDLMPQLLADHAEVLAGVRRGTP